MKRGSIRALALATGIILLPASPALAQTPSPAAPTPSLTPADLSAMYHLPNVFVTDGQITNSTATGLVQGTFTVQNSEPTIMSGLQYEIQLLSPLASSAAGTVQADTATESDQFVSPDMFGLMPQEHKTVSFRYQAPPVPLDTYRLRIRIMTDTGRELGWQDVPLALGIPHATFVLVSTGNIQLPQGIQANANEGVNVAPNTLLTATGVFTNRSDKPVTVTPTVTVYRWGINGQLIRSLTESAVTLQPKQTQTFSLPFQAETTPDAYAVVVGVNGLAGTSISNHATYRYVTTGPSAKVVVARFNQLNLAAGTPIVVSADVVGSADRQTKIDGTVQVDLHDGATVIS